jgi:hypothetical protein
MVGFSLIDAPTGEPVPGYENMVGTQVLDLAKLPTNGLSIEAIVDDSIDSVQFYYHYRPSRRENAKPFALVGDKSCSDCPRGRSFNPSKLLEETGVVHIGAVTNEGRFKKENMCWLDLTVVDSREWPDDEWPDTPVNLEKKDEDGCVKLVPSMSEGELQIKETPIIIKEDLTIAGETLFFTVMNSIDASLNWITAAYVPPYGTEVCDKVAAPALGTESTQVYEAKCFAGFAYIDIYAESSLFSATDGAADTSALPAECKGADSENVVKYTFVVSCDCGSGTKVPDEIVGKPEPNPMACTGPVGVVWGDPHVVPYDGGQWSKFCSVIEQVESHT